MLAAKLTPELVEQLSPLDILRLVARDRFLAGDYNGAVVAASAAAPYLHPRLSSSDVRVRHELSDRSDAELADEGAVGLTIDAEPEPVSQTH